MRSYLQRLIGPYQATGSGFAEADWEFIISGLIVIITIYFVFKLISLIFKSI